MATVFTLAALVVVFGLRWATRRGYCRCLRSRIRSPAPPLLEPHLPLSDEPRPQARPFAFGRLLCFVCSLCSASQAALAEQHAGSAGYGAAETHDTDVKEPLQKTGEREPTKAAVPAQQTTTASNSASASAPMLGQDEPLISR